MKVIELTRIMGSSFVAIGLKGKPISYSGSSINFPDRHWIANMEVAEVHPATNESSATVIYTK